MRWLLALIAVSLTACTHYEPLSLHGAATMRVEVEVYKGPLTSPVEGQVGELVGVLSDAIHMVKNWQDRAADQVKDCREISDCETLSASIRNSSEFLGTACYILRSPAFDGTELGRRVYVPMGTCAIIDKPLTIKYLKSSKNVETQGYIEERRTDIENELKVYIKCLKDNKTVVTEIRNCQRDTIGVTFDNLSAILRGSARRAIDPSLKAIPVDGNLRGLLIEYANLASDYGEQIHSRVVVLQKQMPYDPNAAFTPARNLPVSDYLRSTSRSDYIQLYDWLKGAEKYTGPEFGMLSPEERIRMAQRLTADSYWQKVNEVYASGQGEVAMAFIKDELGNWDLKSFSNDPSELLASYRKVTDAALKTAVKLATKATTGGVGEAAQRIGDAQKMANFANQMATGEVPGTPGVVGGINIAALHDRTAARIAAQKGRFATLETRLTTEASKQKADAEAEGDKQADAKKRQDKATEALKDATTKRDTANDRVLEKRALLRAEQDRTPPIAADVRTADAAVVAALSALAEAQDAVDTAQTTVLEAKDEFGDAETAARDATAKQAAAEQRLAGLPKEAIEAVRGTLDDHLAVVAALQEGVASSATGQGSPKPPVP